MHLVSISISTCDIPVEQINTALESGYVVIVTDSIKFNDCLESLH